MLIKNTGVPGTVLGLKNKLMLQLDYSWEAQYLNCKDEFLTLISRRV